MSEATSSLDEAADQFEQRRINQITIDLLKRWEEDATSDPVQLKIAEEEIGKFKQGMNENRIRQWADWISAASGKVVG